MSKRQLLGSSWGSDLWSLAPHGTDERRNGPTHTHTDMSISTSSAYPSVLASRDNASPSVAASRGSASTGSTSIGGSSTKGSTSIGTNTKGTTSDATTSTSREIINNRMWHLE
ncbi:GL24115 [Drosophila persimilis]|uniref:GL24115 n=1 Tax=Drosophila persimilis TaxID=7234 RepID=B4G3Q6_DROPE|nr:GL24115 [Drosophila persimilis]